MVASFILKASPLLLIVLFHEVSASWKVTSYPIKCPNGTVYTFTAKNDSSVVHFIFAADEHVRPPALIVVHSPFPNSEVNVNCTNYSKNTTFRNSVTVTAGFASYGFLLYQLCDYSDVDDIVRVPDNPDCHRYFGSNLNWKNVFFGNEDFTKWSAIFSGTKLNDSHDTFIDDGSVLLKFSVHETDTDKPSPESYFQIAAGLQVEVTISLDRLTTHLPRTRFAPVLFLFSNQSMEDDDDFVQQSALTDGPLGQTKTVYLILNERVKAGLVEPGTPPAFIHFSPVSRTQAGSVQPAIHLRDFTLGSRIPIRHKGSAHKFSRSLVYAYYGDRFNQIHEVKHENCVGVREQFINLGTRGDGGYVASNYSSWSFVLGIGSPPTAHSDSHVGAALAYTGLFAGTLAASVGLGVYYRRRRQNAQSHIQRFEPMVLPVSAAQSSTAGLVEPFQMRKVRLPFGGRGGGTSSTEPLLAAQPPSYDSISAETNA
ncbi:hypothetical protein PHET_07259 [Paragonimus heterotremus]|uniref:Transmembrane protein n=1 Tax=Paragonimus heterotremus TaxID=100268 RepID=A0A8J4WDA7_9TREM|nr:hypothetical protein PHET_07259 [Paragonimus heterotremus]